MKKMNVSINSCLQKVVCIFLSLVMVFSFFSTSIVSASAATVRIGHASMSENGTENGKAGDETGWEVFVQDWYSHPWEAVFRPNSPAVAEKIAKAMEQACANNKIGYGQSDRDTLYKVAEKKKWDLSKVNVKCNTDCSALVAVCVNAAGIKIPGSMWTGNEENLLNKTGKFTEHKETKYTASSRNLKRGDILWTHRYGHTAIVLSNGAESTASSTSTKKPVSTLKFTGCTAPTGTHTLGSFYNLKGSVSSNYAIKSITGRIVNASTGKDAQTPVKVSPNKTSYSIGGSTLDYNLKFDALKAGTYYLRYEANDGMKTVTWQSNNFTVKPKSSTLKITGCTAPTGTHTLGSFYDLKGSVSSNYAIKSITGRIVNASTGKDAQTPVKVSPNKTSYSIGGSTLDYNLKFDALKAGTYYLRYEANDGMKTVTWQSTNFTVKPKSIPASSTLKITGCTAPTGTHTLGSFYDLKGSISSNYAIKSITGRIVNVSTGRDAQTPVKVSPNKTSYSIGGSTLDYNLKFDALAAGTYFLYYEANDGMKTVTWWSSNFTVKPKSTPASSTLKITGCTAPNGTHTLGSFYDLKGSVSSNYAIKSITGRIVNVSTGKDAQTPVKVSPNKTSYSIGGSTLDYNLKFDALTTGTYYLRYEANDGMKTVTWWSSNFTVKPKATPAPSTLKITGCTAPTGTHTLGSFYDLKGSVSSNYAIKSITGRIVNASTGRDAQSPVNVYPNKTSYSIGGSTLDYNLKFDALTTGTYYLRYEANDGMKTVTWQSSNFTVAQKPSTLAFSGVSVPSSVRCGMPVDFSGQCTSNYRISWIKTEFVDASTGSTLSYPKPASQSFNSTSVQLYNTTLDNNTRWDLLPRGRFYLRLTAADVSGKTQVWISNVFTVW